MRTKTLAILLAGGSLLLAGCATEPTIGTAPGSPPPQLVKDPQGNIMWSNIGSFGPVPANRAAEGAKICAEVGARALGYHPAARGTDGVAFKAGGFYCVPK